MPRPQSAHLVRARSILAEVTSLQACLHEARLRGLFAVVHGDRLALHLLQRGDRRLAIDLHLEVERPILVYLHMRKRNGEQRVASRRSLRTFCMSRRKSSSLKMVPWFSAMSSSFSLGMLSMKAIVAFLRAPIVDRKRSGRIVQHWGHECWHKQNTY